MNNLREVNQELAIAGQLTPFDLQEVASSGFKSVLNLRHPAEEGFLLDEQQQAEASGLRYVNLPVTPETMGDELTTSVLQEIDELPKPLLVHCASGMRAGAMTLMQFATRNGMTADEAFEVAGRIGFDCNAYPQMKQFFAHYVNTYSNPN